MAHPFQKIEIPFKYDDLTTNTDGNGRRYFTPDGKIYPSITTVMGSLSKDAVEEWRKRVGEEEANRVSHHASTRGTIVHDIMERYINGEEINTKKMMPHHLKSFRDLSQIVDDRLTEVYVQEKALYSHHLKVAGRVDLVGRFDGVRSIIDFKTSTRIKKKEWISSYFMQTAAYSIMFEELTGIPIPNLVIIMDIDNNSPIVFKEHRDNWVEELIKTIKEYHRNTEWIKNLGIDS